METIFDVVGAAAASAVATQVPAVLPAHTRSIELSELQLNHSKEIWRNMDIFSSFVTKEDVQRAREEELRQQCAVSGGQVTYVPAADSETAKSVNQRHNKMHKALQQLKPADKRENSRATKTRLKLELVQKLESKELSTQELDHFLNNTLENLPLSVRLCGEILHHMGGLWRGGE